MPTDLPLVNGAAKSLNNFDPVTLTYDLWPWQMDGQTDTHTHTHARVSERDQEHYHFR